MGQGETHLIASLRCRLQRVLEHRRLPWLLAGVACALCVPSLWIGWQTDDYLHRASLQHVPEFPMLDRSPLDLFSFVSGDPKQNREAMDIGLLPWWSHETLRLSFFRPITGLTHWIDYQLWPKYPLLMHVHSLAWFAGVVACVAVLYRRLMEPVWVAGLAAVMFAVDDAHGLPAVWLANRNSVVAMLFGMLSLLAYDKWRRDGWRRGGAIAPIMMLLALLSAEAAVATGAYLLSYALFIDRGSLKTRFAALIPCTIVGVGWWALYKWMGFGASGSGLYVDPAVSPLRFLAAVGERFPLLLWGQWSFPPSDLHLVLIQSAANVMWVVAVIFLVAFLMLIVPIVAHEKTCRFFLFGALVGALPSCSTFVSDRLLMFVGFGGMGVVAVFTSAVLRRLTWLPRVTRWRYPAVACCAFMLIVHLVAAPLLLNQAAQRIQQMGAVLDQSSASLPAESEVRKQQVFIVNAPTAFLATFAPVIQALRGAAVPAVTMVLASGIQPMRIRRADDYTLVIRPKNGFLGLRGEMQNSDDSGAPLIDARYIAPIFDQLFRDRHTPFVLGQRIELAHVTIEITELTQDGRPAEAAFHFVKRLDDPSHLWRQWKNGVYVSFPLPAIDESITLPPVTLAI